MKAVNQRMYKMDDFPVTVQADTGAAEEPQVGPGDIPAATWAMIQQAGHKAAGRLLELLDGREWSKLKAGDKLRLVELAMNRAYGPPIKREQRLELRGDVSDAVAASLAKLSSFDLPELRARATQRAAESDLDAEIVSDSQEDDTPLSEALRGS